MEKFVPDDAYVKDQSYQLNSLYLYNPPPLSSLSTTLVTMQMFGEIPDFLFAWIEEQQMFWVASAPLTADGLVNISPKGVEGTFHIAGPRKVWYEDLTGTGVETISHIRENGRATILFNAYKGPPRITRLYGKGSVHEFGTPEYNALLPEGTRHAGSRAVVVLDVFKVATTCGYAVPFYEFQGHRTQLIEWAAKKEAADRDTELTVGFSSSTSPRNQNGMKRWWEERNTTSLDGLPGVISAHVSNEIFRSTKIPDGGDNDIKSKLSNAIGPMDLRIFIAFLFGVICTILYGHLRMVAQEVLIIKS
ncbi:hypothetical protein BDZ94DRAFT_1260983 [Collybia nuda]|uniref:Pyridoxamine 5'-phosphate oxidase putative domain-containing protein n=1 Tax=Collybia nuda TaxID=64659 RepID=A0A9P6CJ34_9AGAR|nr:hypothetical protein BDZ94DRAFT_1260983 [Collybia nuda]